jgi:DNA-binding transcriptional LysR family regulator
VLINHELLRTLLTVGTSDSFAHAAARRGVTPPAISQQIKSLEAQLGVPLFERIGRRAKLTKVGADLVAVLQQQFASVDEAVAAVIEDHKMVRGLVRIGGPRPFSTMWLRPRLVQLFRTHPDLKINVAFDVPSALTRRLLEGSLDLCILVSPVDHPLLEVKVVHIEDFVAVASPHYLKQRGTPSTADEFRKHPFIVYDADLAMLAPWWRASFGRHAPLPENFICQVTSLDEIMSFAEEALGIGVLPSYFVTRALEEKSLVLLRTAGRSSEPLRGNARNPISLAWRKATIQTARFLAVRTALMSPV